MHSIFIWRNLETPLYCTAENIFSRDLYSRSSCIDVIFISYFIIGALLKFRCGFTGFYFGFMAFSIIFIV